MSVTFAPAGHIVADGDDVLCVDTTHPLAVNVSNTNASHLLATLGFDPFELDGDTTGEDMLGRVLIAQATAEPDDGVEPEGKRIVDCGRRPGYTGDKLDLLRCLAQETQDAGVRIAWC